MRLHSFAFVGAPGPVMDGLVPFGELTRAPGQRRRRAGLVPRLSLRSACGELGPSTRHELSQLLAEDATPFLDDLAPDGVLAVLSGRAEAPFPILAIGDVPIGVLPVPILVPTKDAEIVSLATDTISEVLRHLEFMTRIRRHLSLSREDPAARHDRLPSKLARSFRIRESRRVWETAAASRGGVV